MNIINNRILLLRKILNKYKIEAFFQPHEDEFLGEYIPEHSERLNWITGFSGSAGSTIITKKDVFLFVDGRYTIQAEKETKDTKIKVISLNFVTLEKWIHKNMNFKTLSLDLKLISQNNFIKIKDALVKNKSTIRGLTYNPIDKIWIRRKKLTNSKSFIKYSIKHSGENSLNKKKLISSKLKSLKVDAGFIPSSDSVAWLLNLRGRDLKYTPVILAQAIIKSNGTVFLFLEDFKYKSFIKNHLDNKTKVFPLEKLNEHIKALGKNKLKFLIDTKLTSTSTYLKSKKAGLRILERDDPIIESKSIKNKIEIKGSKKSHIDDGKALCKFLYWYSQNTKKSITELDVVNKIDFLRKQNDNFICLSFPTIAASGSNGAIIHYRANKGSNRIIKQNDLLLLDSGGQYLNGTTDVTRTIFYGKENQKIKNIYTLVLKGHIGVSTAQFPVGTTGAYLDSIARFHLWKNNLNYEHGTGHGVGHCLNVHEGPQTLSPHTRVPLQPGMILSNEPGCYKDKSYGIRIENLLFVKSTNKINSNKSKFLKLETLTLAPYERNLIEKSLLDNEEIKWINKYHKDVYRIISHHLEEKEKKWLFKICAPI